MLNLEEMLASELPQARYLMLELAGLLDRLDEAAQRDNRSLGAETRMQSLRDALYVLSDSAGQPDRAERILRIHSETQAPAGGR